MKRIAIFASYSKEGIIADYVLYYLQGLKNVADDIVFIADNEIQKEEAKKLQGLVTYYKCERHGCYDFGSYRIGFEWLEKKRILDEVDELIFCNDSCYGPVYPLKDIFEEMDSRKSVDFWGMFDSNESEHHIMSFFLSFKKKVFQSHEFCNFVHSFRKLGNFWDYVDQYEKRFTAILEKAGFKSDVFLKIDKESLLKYAYQSGNGNIMLYPVTICRHGMPLIKVKAMNNTFGNDLRESPIEVMEMLKDTNKELFKIVKDDLERRGVQVEDRWLTPSQIIGNAKIVSFDIFDTLLFRPFKKPTDLFLLIEKELKVPGFAKKRVEAELNARKKYSEQSDVSIDQIYEMLAPEYSYLKQEELRYESELLFVKEDIYQIYLEALKKKCRVIAVSDMYLSKNFLEKILHDKGYDGITDVFVSNEADCCKGNGDLFRYVIKTLNINPSEMVHIGDNPISDKEAPEKLGIRACHKYSHYEALKNMPSLAKLQCFSFIEKLSISFLSAIFAQHKVNSNISDPYKELGYILGGPLAVGYSQHIKKTVDECSIDGLLFVSRDGYALREIYNKLYPDSVDNFYIQTSRNLILKNSTDYSDEMYRKKVFDMYTKENKILSEYTEDIFIEYLPAIKEWSNTKSQKYKQYIDILGIKGNKLMSVDMTTREYTSLKILKNIFNERIFCGMFSTSYGEPCKYNVKTYSKEHWTSDDDMFLMLQEELITAPEFTVDGFGENNQFHYSQWNSTEKWRIANYKKILAGIHEFADDFIRLSASHKIDIDFSDNWLLIKNYVQYSNFGDMELFKHMYHDIYFGEIFISLYDELHVIEDKKKKEAADKEKEPEKIKEIPVVSINNGDNYYYLKNRKHLRIMRYLIGLSVLEFVSLIGCIMMWLGYMGG